MVTLAIALSIVPRREGSFGLGPTGPAAVSTPTSTAPAGASTSTTRPRSSTTATTAAGASTTAAPSTTVSGASTTTTPGTPTTTAPAGGGALQLGSTGAAVTTLQQRLTAAGYSPGAADGVFGATTAAAVTAFQRAKGLTADGVAGSQTLAALGIGTSVGGVTATRPALQLGSRGSDVTTLQQRLAALGYSPGAADGVFGATTAAAVTAFQRAKGLTADGVVGPQTWSALGV